MLTRVLSTLLVLVLAGHGDAWTSAAAERPPAFTVRITSPLGRTGQPERIRIVAQIRGPEDLQIEPVRFFVDSELVGEDRDGPPYAIEWTDANPFEPTEIVVEVRAADAVARDRVLLEPLAVSEKTGISSVVLDVAVHDKEGRFVTGLDAASFRLLEDGVRQSLDQVQQTSMAATYTLLIDTSQSMSRQIDMVRRAAALLVRHLRPDDRVVVAPFAKNLGAITGPTIDHQTVVETIDTLSSSGGTAILNAVQSVTKAVGPSDSRHALVLFTDGHDEHSTASLEQAVDAVKNLHATLYVIGIPGSAGISLKGERFLRDLAAETGGRAFFPVRDRDLEWVDERLTEEVQQRYLVAYSPSNQIVDGKWREIALATGNPDWRIRTRKGYFAPEPPPIRPSLEFTMMNAERELIDVSVENLTVLEDGVEQELEVFQEAVAPVSIVLALDSSGSMVKAADGVKAAAESFVAAIRPEDTLALATFADAVWFAHDLATERSWSLQGIGQYVARGGTALYDAMYGAFARLKRTSGRRVLVLVTDGRDENNAGTGPGSTRTLDEMLKALRDSEATVFAIGLGPRVDRELLERVAAESGGEAYFPSEVAELDVHYRRVVENLRRRYVISYTSTNSERDGAWRTVQITSRMPSTTVRSKGGYYAPADTIK